MEYHICWDDWEDDVTGSTKVEAENLGSAYCAAIEKLALSCARFSRGDIENISYVENGEEKTEYTEFFIKDPIIKAQIEEYAIKNNKPYLINKTSGLFVNAEKGSLLYRINEKVAYKIGELYPQESNDSNWFRAQRYLKNWEKYSLYDSNRIRLLETIEKRVNGIADYYKKNGWKCDDPEYEFVVSIINDVRRYTDK